MGDRAASAGRGRSSPGPAWLRNSSRWIAAWPVWGLRRPVLCCVLVVEAVAVLAAGYTALRYPVTGLDWERAGILAACALVHLEVTRTNAWQSRMASGPGPYVDQKSVWNFAALVILPPALATAMVLFTHGYSWARIWFVQQCYPSYRWVYSAATVVVATQLAVAVLQVGVPGHPKLPGGLESLAVVAAAGAVRWAVNYALIILVLVLSEPGIGTRKMLGNAKDQRIEASSVAFGFCAAALLVFQPVYVVAPLVALLATQHTALLRHYERAAQTDAKTGLLNSDWWRRGAEQAITRARLRGTRVGILMADLDHFKAVNDTYGHLRGDDVLVAVADAISGHLRRDVDLAGRFGGEEFAVLLPGVGEKELRAAAERLRHEVGALRVPAKGRGGGVETIGVTVSIGAAVSPRGGASLDELVLRADDALYDAKRLGRNRVCVYGDVEFEQSSAAG
jgi:diguanylate cyclase (GGDEF)-like protein